MLGLFAFSAQQKPVSEIPYYGNFEPKTEFWTFLEKAGTDF